MSSLADGSRTSTYHCCGSIRIRKSYKLEGAGFGPSTYSIYEADSGVPEGKKEEAPYFFVWLHGADMGDISPSDLENIQRHLGRRTFFMVPLNPKPSSDGLRFNWGVAYTKAQNKNSLGFVFGKLHAGYLEALTSAISDRAHEVDAERVLVSGYSMGGFGAYQLGCFAPEAFDAVISVAGYGLGTTESSDQGYGAPQPHSSQILEDFLEQKVVRLAHVPIVIAIHAQSDTVSHFKDNEAIIETVRSQDKGGVAELIEVPSSHADSDPGRKNKPKLGHNYFNYALLDATSEGVLWQFLREKLCTQPYRRETVVPLMPVEMNLAI